MVNSVKKITLLLVIIFTFLFSTTSWGEWSFLVESQNGDKWYYDKERVRKRGKYIYFWMLIDFYLPFQGDLSKMSYFQLDCSIFRYKELRIHGYKNSMGEGKSRGEWTPKDEWMYLSPKSAMEFMLNKVCEEQQRSTSSVGSGVKKKKGVLFRTYYSNSKWTHTKTYGNDGEYEGDIENGKPNGYGKKFMFLTKSNIYVKTYEGEWRYGKRHGQGKEFGTDFDFYVGGWKDGEKNGQGTMLYYDGEKIVGKWEKNMPWNATVFDKNGDKKFNWVNGKRANE